MKDFSRCASGKPEPIISIERPFSNFRFLDERFPDLPPLHRIFSQVRQLGGRTLVVEEIADEKDTLEENEDLKENSPSYSRSLTHRLCFFSKRFSTRRGLLSASKDDFLGYALVKGDYYKGSDSPSAHVYESVVRPSRYTNNFIHGQQKWSCSCLGEDLQIEGYLYAQQNGCTKTCAHVAARSAAARFHPAGDMLYREINEVARSVALEEGKKGWKPSEGLSNRQIVGILESAGARCVLADYTKHYPKAGARVPFQKYIYGSIESGFPVILFFGTTAGSYHTIPVFGHTFNEDTWVPSAEFSYFRIGDETACIPSESWVSMYIAHDDNWGSNFCIPRHYLHTTPLCHLIVPHAPPFPCPEQPERVSYVIATLPKAASLNAVQAEAISLDFLSSILPALPEDDPMWKNRLLRLGLPSSYVVKPELVVRPLLISGKDYVAQLRKIRDWNGGRIGRSWASLLERVFRDDLLWVVEISVPELFQANRRKIGEIVLRNDPRASLTKRDFRSFVLARLLGHFAVYKTGSPSDPQYIFGPSGLTGHVELFGCESEEPKEKRSSPSPHRHYAHGNRIPD